MTDPERRERLRRWRMVLGGPAEEALGAAEGRDGKMDAALAALYDAGDTDEDGRPVQRSGGLGGSAPRVARWLGDIREYFPSTVVQVMQADAIERLDLSRLLLEPEMLAAVEPDVHLVGTLLSLNRVMPDDDPGGRAAGDPQRRRRPGETHRPADPGRGHRRAEPGRPDQPAPARATSTGTAPSARTCGTTRPEYRTVVPAAADRLRPPHRRGPARRGAVRRPVRLDGRVGGLLRCVRRRAGLDPVAAHLAGGLRHRGGGPDRAAAAIRSRCCSAPSWAAAPTSTGRSPTASS